MKANITGIHKVKSNGHVYYYAWRGGPRLLAEPGTKAFLAEYLKATKHQEQATEAGTFSSLVTDYKASPEYTGLARHSKRSYERLLRALVDEYGNMPVGLLEAKGMRGDFLRFRDSMADKPATADMHMAVLRAVLSWAVKRELIAVNKAAEIGKLNRSTRRDRIWSEEECQRFISTVSPPMAHGLLLALNTGQRQGDLLKLTWTAYDGSTISLRQTKTGSSVRLRTSPELRAMLNSMPRTTVTILTNSYGRPWKQSAFQSAFNRAMKKAGITGLTFHDLKGTFLSRGRALGYSLAELSDASGTNEQTIKRYYMNISADVTSIRNRTGREL
jgi:integrase